MSRQTIQASIVINAPVDFVWEVTSDPATYVEGIDWVYEARGEDAGPLRLGSVYVERAKPGLREGDLSLGTGFTAFFEAGGSIAWGLWKHVLKETEAHRRANP